MTHLKLFENTITPFDVLFKNFFDTTSPFSPAVEAKFPHPVDIYENKDGLHFEVACTGLTKEDIQLSLEGDILKIIYDKLDDDKCCDVDNCNYIKRGIARRSFNLGYKISPKFNLSQANAGMENGLLKISIPFAEEAKPKVLKIK